MQTKGPNLQNLVVQWKRAHSSSTLTILFSRDLFQTFLAQASSRKSLSLKTELKIHIEQLLLLNTTDFYQGVLLFKKTLLLSFAAAADSHSIGTTENSPMELLQSTVVFPENFPTTSGT